MAAPTHRALAAVAGGVGGLSIVGLIPAILGMIGFGTLGPIAGSLAAAIQASIGNVAAGSAFAIAQSVAMGGMSVWAWLSAAIGGMVAGQAMV